MIRRGCLASLLALVLAALPNLALAQSQATTGVIEGTVSDPTGAPVPGATVVVKNTATNLERTLSSDADGRFRALLLPLGPYRLTVSLKGFATLVREGIELSVGQSANLALTLKVSSVQEQIVVQADSPVIETTRAESATRVNQAAIRGLPNNGRNFLDFAKLTPGVSIVQGPDGDELTVNGQKGIHNNVSVDGADFNNPFFGEQRGGQRPPFTFNLDAVQEVVVVAEGANAEFGRSNGAFVNVVTKSGTNDVHGTAHFYFKNDGIASAPKRADGSTDGTSYDFSQQQAGFTLGGPIVKDKAFYFFAFDYQNGESTKQTDPNRIEQRVVDYFASIGSPNENGSITRTNDARVFLGKVDWQLGSRHLATVRYSYTWSDQKNGTFDVDSWGTSSNADEKDYSHAVSGALTSTFSATLLNEFRFQWAREYRPRPYEGPLIAGQSRALPDTAFDFGSEYRFGMPFFIPVQYYDKRIQILDNVSIVRGNHFIKFGGEYNKVNSIQTFIGFANSRYIFSSVDGFLTFMRNPGNPDSAGAVLLYLQQAGVDQDVISSGTQDIGQTDIGLYVQDSWKPNSQLTVNYGLRWEGELQPDPITPPSDVFYAPFIGQSVTNATGTYAFPSDGTIPSDKSMWQPRLGITYDPRGNGRQVFRGSAGLYYARIPALNLASSRSTNGSNGFTYFRNSALTGVLGPVPGYGSLLPDNVPANAVFYPDVFVFDKDFQNPRTFNATVGYDRQLSGTIGASITYTYAQTDHLTRFVNRNDAVFGNPWSTGLAPGGTNGVTALTTVESSAKSRFHGVTLGVRRVLDPDFQFEMNYTLSWDKSDDDNERDPFTTRHARPDILGPEYNWSDRDQRHRFNGWFLWRVLGSATVNGRISYASAQPVSMSCGPSERSPFAPAYGERAASAADRNCGAVAADSVLPRNTLRKDNQFFSLDLGLTYPINLGARGRVEGILQVFNVTGSENFRDPAYGSLLFNFDGTIAAGYGDPRQAQVGLRWVF